MATLTRSIHLQTSFAWKPLRELAPDVKIEMPADANGASPETVMALALADPDGEIHMYVLSESGRRQLVDQLTGGIVIPGDPRGVG